MQAFLELSKIWPWLPHFRVVAEFESLSRASRRFGISSAALSKAIQKLERMVDVELFDRAGGKLRLTGAGRTLLAALRTDMRELDDMLRALHGREGQERLQVAIDGGWAAIAIPGRARNIALHEPLHAPEPLIRGEVDVVVHTEPFDMPGVDSQAVGSFESRSFATRSARADAPLVVWDNRHGLARVDELDVAITTASLAHAVGLAATGAYTVILPTQVAEKFCLVPVGDETHHVTTLWCAVRTSRRPSAAAKWRDALREHLRR